MLPCLWGSGNPGVVTASSHRPPVQYVCRGLIWYLPRKLNNLKILKNAIIPAGTAPPIVHRNTFIRSHLFPPRGCCFFRNSVHGVFLCNKLTGKEKEKKESNKERKEKEKYSTVQYCYSTVTCTSTSTVTDVFHMTPLPELPDH